MTNATSWSEEFATRSLQEAGEHLISQTEQQIQADLEADFETFAGIARRSIRATRSVKVSKAYRVRKIAPAVVACREALARDFAQCAPQGRVAGGGRLHLDSSRFGRV